MLDIDSEASLHVPSGPSAKFLHPAPFLCFSEAAGREPEQPLAFCSPGLNPSLFILLSISGSFQDLLHLFCLVAVSYSYSHMYPAPRKEVPDSGVTALNETARVPALQGSVSLGSLLKLVYTYLCLPVCGECVGVCDIAFSQGQDDYFPRSVLSILYSPCQTLNSLRAEFSIFLCIDQSPAKGPCFLPTPLF